MWRRRCRIHDANLPAVTKVVHADGGRGTIARCDRQGPSRGLLAAADERDDTTAIRFAFASPSRGWTWEWSSPGSPEQYFVASVTKLFTASIVMQLRSEGRVDLDAPAATYLDPSVMAGIHVLRAVDASERITTRELLSNTSGIADYFEGRQRNGHTQLGDVLVRDAGWSFDEVLRITKEEMEPRFAPSTPGKAFYSDSNFQIVGALIEAVSGVTFEAALEDRILGPLGLTGTYAFTTETIGRYDEVAPILHGTRRTEIPRAMASVRAQGGIVSTARDGVTFLEALIAGELFPGAFVGEMQRDWNRIFRPFEYGIGMMRFALPRYYSPFRPIPPMVGHAGASGAVLYHVPSLDLYVAGTVNQAKDRALSHRVLARLVMACDASWRTGS